jgi:anti-sigma factor RsiW
VTPEQHPLADEAARYILGQLSPRARHEFEVQLAQSAELRALVQELEAGIEAMARTVPQRPPPPQAWSPIEQAIAREANRKILRLPSWSGWWRNGWAAAAACLLAFLSYAWWSTRPSHSPDTVASTDPGDVAPTLTQSVPAVEGSRDAVNVVVPKAFEALAMEVEANLRLDAETNSSELLRLRGQVAAMRSQLAELSATVSQQSAIMGEPGRFKFFSLQGDDLPGAENAPPTLSAGLQRAIFYAMAQDLGWLPPAPSASVTGSRDVVATKRTAWGIDFVELSQTLSAAAGSDPQASSAGTVSFTAANVSVSTSGDIPGYLKRDAGRELVLAFDPTIVPGGSKLEFWSDSPVSGHRLMGSALTGENPMVVTIPTGQINGELTILSRADGTTAPKVVGQFFILRYPTPVAPLPPPAP